MSGTSLTVSRSILLLLSSLVFAASCVLIVRFDIKFQPSYWSLWLSLALSAVSSVVYAFSFRVHTYVSPRVRSISVSLLCALWLVSPIYHIRSIANATGSSRLFFATWNCGELACTLLMASDICGLLVAFVGWFEVYFAEKYDRSYAQKPVSNAMTTILISAGAQQQTQYIPLEQQHQQMPYFQPQAQAAPIQPYPYNQGYGYPAPASSGAHY